MMLSFLINRQFCVVLDGKSSQKYPVNVELLKAPTFSLLFITDFPDVIYDIAIYCYPLFTLSVIGHMICSNN